MQPTIPVHTEMLTWAITRAGYRVQEFVEHHPRVQQWMEGEKRPSLPQLRDFAKKVNVPFGYLLLEKPPEETLPLPFFRSVNGGKPKINLNVRDAILTLQRRQDWIREYLAEHGNTPLNFVGRFADNRGMEIVVQDIRNTLGLSDMWASAFRNRDEALDHLKKQIEAVGIFTVFNSVVDNNTRRSIPVDDCRGFVLVDQHAPFMFVNSADSKAAQMFTLVHELAHIWVGESAGFDFRQLQPAEDKLEKFCDQVAAEFLVPENVFNKLWSEQPDFSHISRKLKVSQLVIARRALDLKKIDRNSFFEFYEDFYQQFKKKKEKQSDGGNFYATLKNRLNTRFFYTVHRAVKENKLLHREAYQLTGLKGKTFENAVHELQA